MRYSRVAVGSAAWVHLGDFSATGPTPISGNADGERVWSAFLRRLINGALLIIDVHFSNVLIGSAQVNMRTELAVATARHHSNC